MCLSRCRLSMLSCVFSWSAGHPSPRRKQACFICRQTRKVRACLWCLLSLHLYLSRHGRVGERWKLLYVHFHRLLIFLARLKTAYKRKHTNGGRHFGSNDYDNALFNKQIHLKHAQIKREKTMFSAHALAVFYTYFVRCLCRPRTLRAKAKSLHDNVLEEGRDFAPVWDSGDTQASAERKGNGREKLCVHLFTPF